MLRKMIPAVLMPLFLSGCFNSYSVKIDKRLTVPCERPVLNGNTIRDGWALAVEQQSALIECDTRMRIIREMGE